MKILQPSSAEEEEEARHEAAFSPDIYDVVVAHFDGELPRSDEPIKAYLIRTLGFSKSGAEDCIGTLRKTLSELEGFKSNLRAEAMPTFSSSSSADVSAEQPTESEQPPEPRLGRSMARSSGLELVIPLTRDCTAELQLVGEVTSAAIDRLVQYIELMRGVWAED
ncbi:MAG: hypothetical protein H0V46_01060 [Sphingomonas sp.]|nr:hypothetical protein [Sphingomonas sp.]